MREWRYSSTILDLGTRWCAVNFRPRPLYPRGKSPWYPLHKRLGGSKNLTPGGIESRSSIPYPVAIPALKMFSEITSQSRWSEIRNIETVNGGKLSCLPWQNIKIPKGIYIAKYERLTQPLILRFPGHILRILSTISHASSIYRVQSLITFC
jgi:hypothetical protein